MKRNRLFAAAVCFTLLAAGCNTTDATEAEENSDAAATNHAVKSTVTLTEGKYSEEKLDATWDEKTAAKLKLDGTSISADSEAVEVKDNVATITAEGEYVISGELENGQIIVDVPNKGNVQLVLNGAEITCNSSAPIWIKEGNTVITLAEGTENTVTDGSEYVLEEGEDEPNGTIFAKDDLTFNGTGTLMVNGNYNHAIQSKDDLKFVTGTYVVTSVGDGIVGKDSVSVKNGNFKIETGGDGIKATNIEETDKGYILIENGYFGITSAGDAVQAETLLRVNDGEFEIVTGGGSGNAVQTGEAMGDMRGFGGRGGRMQENGVMPDGSEVPQDGEMPQRGQMPENGEMPERGEIPDRSHMPENGEVAADGQMMGNGEVPTGGSAGNTEMPSDTADSSDTTETDSMKALKSYVDLIVAGGEFTIDSCDDALHSNQNVKVEDGTFTITAGDDGAHAEDTLDISGGTIEIQKSYEGLEGFDIVISGGDIKVTASDDGVNAAGDDDSAVSPEDDASESEDTADTAVDQVSTGIDQNVPQRMKTGMRGGMGGGMAGEDQGAALTVSGGSLYVNAEGDGLDANGDISISGGTVTVHGPSNSGNGTLDYASQCKIIGGTFLGVGSVGMSMNPSEDSTQPIIVQNMSSSVESGTTISVKDASGSVIAEVQTEKAVQWYTISSSQMKIGETYTVCVGDEETEVTLDATLTQVQ